MVGSWNWWEKRTREALGQPHRHCGNGGGIGRGRWFGGEIEGGDVFRADETTSGVVAAVDAWGSGLGCCRDVFNKIVSDRLKFL